MKSPRISIRKARGFTLIEILIVTAIFATLAGLGLFASMDAYRLYSFNVERSMLVSMLEQARGRAMSNLGESEHTLRIESTRYVLKSTTLPDEETERNENITSSSFPIEITFEQLSGKTDDETFTISDENSDREVEININEEGRINWQKI